MSSTVSQLEDVLRERRGTRPPGSYSAQLFAQPELLQRKIMEEAFEVCLELGRAECQRERLVAESADLFFHVLVALVGCGLSFEDVAGELARRRR